MTDEPLAYFITWTSYGTWLPGDDRGWTKWHHGDQLPQPLLADWCREQMTDTPVYLDTLQRETVESVIDEHCAKREWILHAANCRTNHCHVVVTASGYGGEIVRDQFKAWGTTRLKERQRKQSDGIQVRENWWSRKGSVRHIDDIDSLEFAIRYTRDAQDNGGSKGF